MRYLAAFAYIARAAGRFCMNYQNAPASFAAFTKPAPAPAMPTPSPADLGATVQQRLFERIKAATLPYQSVVDEVADALGLSPDSVYRRMRGEKALTLDEALRLCRRYRLSLDGLDDAATGTVAFQYSRLQSADDFEQYLEGMAHFLGLMQAAEQRQMLYGAADVAIFHSFGHPEYRAFKLFYWQQSVLRLPELQGVRFSPERVSARALALAEKIYQRYYAVPSVEIWTVYSALTACRQLGYYYEAGLFESPALARTVVSQLRAALAGVVAMAEKDSKDEAGRIPFQLYESEIQIGNNTVLAQAGPMRITYVSHQTFNVMTTQNPDFCDDTEAFLRGLIRRSTLISGVSERQRAQFFAKIVEPVEGLLARIQG